jgi:ABC-type proline/glycine betaine transport system permease subunit
MHDVIAYITIITAVVLGIPLGVAIERWRIIRMAKKYCPELYEKLHEQRKL